MSSYWNSRLATERQRLISCFTRDDVVCDVFSGVGPIAIAAAKKVKHVHANDLNPYAVDYLERNCVLNKLERKIKVFNMDGRRFIDVMFSSENAHSITQVVMNLPNDAAEYLDAFRGIFTDKPNDKMLPLPKIHVYGFSKAEDPEFDFHQRIRIALMKVEVAVDMHRVRLVAPGKWMLSLRKTVVPLFSAISPSPSTTVLNKAFFPFRPSFPFQLHPQKQFSVRCSYAEANIKNDFISTTIDVIADIKPERLVVIGGSGFIGSAICKATMSKGIENRAAFLHKSLGRSGFLDPSPKNTYQDIYDEDHNPPAKKAPCINSFYPQGDGRSNMLIW
ncbi:hypothetical protein Ancab_025290 [Ancistrocladus abbreviatus]